MPKRANLFRCQQQQKQKKKKKKKTTTTSALVPHRRIRKGKRVVKPSKQMDVDQPEAKEIHFQEDIIMEILSRLPVRSLVRFKCVSKFWKTLISDPYFTMKHLSHAKNDSNSHRLLVRQLLGFNSSTKLLYFNFYSSSLVTPEDVQKLDCPSNYKPTGLRIFSCCNGLALLGVVSEFDEQLFLWNPSTREHTLLPHTEFTTKYTTFGLGYDAIDGGYKILKLDWCVRKPRSIEVLVLALKGGSWRKMCHYPTFSCPKRGYIREISPCLDRFRCVDYLAFVNGAFHWLGEAGIENFCVVSFSFSIEVFRFVPLLEQMHKNYNWRQTVPDYGLSSWEGMLCFYSTHTRLDWSTFKLWVMKDYGVKESWTVSFTIQVHNLYSAQPKYRFADGDVLLYQPLGRIMLSKFWTSKGPFGLWPQCYSVAEGMVYTESLISPKSLI